MSVILYPCMFCVALLMDLLFCVLRVSELFVETIRNMFGVSAILLMNVMDLFSVAGGTLLDRSCMVFQRICVLCL